jgi:hypothetical protein
MITREEISKMTREEKWQTLDLLHDSLDEDEPSWVERLLAERRAGFEAGNHEKISLDEIEQRFRARRA